MDLSTLADWTGAAIISKLVDTACLNLGERKLPAGLKNRLESALPEIKAVMRAAEALKIKHPNSGVKAWLEKFRLAFQAAEDVIDELKYRELEDMVKNRDQVSGFVKSKLDQLKRKFSESFGSAINVDTLRRLREAVEMLDRAATGVGPFYQLATSLEIRGLLEPHREAGKISSRETTSFITESEVIGRETEQVKIIEWLKKPVSPAHISIFCIVGVGGLGKTTLAQLIFQEMSRENYFDKTIWVCVSTSFSVEDITRKILEELGEKSDGAESLNGLQKRMKEKILSRKVLLILDDVWNDDKLCDWEKLMTPLRFVQQESKILLTTRMKSVADKVSQVLNVEREDLVLEGLVKQELQLLMNKYAFHRYNPDNYRDLQIIGNQIVEMLHGSPLAAKVIGSLLNSSMDFHYWKGILKSGSLINSEKAKDVVDLLKLSYYYLSTELQECFRFCCIFPQDYLFKKKELIRMWMASGFIGQQNYRQQRPEDIAEQYFNDLLSKSFFQDVSEHECVMHDMMHDLARIVSNGECCRVERNDRLVTIPSIAQHVSVHEGEIERIYHLTNLRTLIIEMSRNKDSVELVDRFVLPSGVLKKTLRLLIIRAYHSYELPEEIGCLIHLRYLSIQLTSWRSAPCLLPQSTYKLHHLEVLELPQYFVPTDCSRIQTTGITNLVSLRYLNVPDDMMQNIQGVHKLTSLQELTFLVGHENGYIDELKMLNNLRHLSIKKIENVRGDPAEAKNANLSRKESLISLSLNWTLGSNCDNFEQIIDNLRPHPNIRELTIDGYKGRRSPIWLRDLPPLDLSCLKLSGCPMWEDLSFVGQMPHLKKLSLIGMNEVKEVHYSFDSTDMDCANAFPSLEKLYCEKMPKWESWAGPHRYGFPYLKELTIKECPNLAELPAMPLSLFSFVLNKVGLNSLPDIYHSSTITTTAPSSLKSSLRKVEISNCQNLKSLNGFLQQENLDLHALGRLTIANCENLEQLPIGAFGKFVSLKHLSIKGSPKLVAVDNQSILLPVKLRSLSMGNCGALDVPLLESASSLTTLDELTIEKSAHITHILPSENAFGSLSSLSIKQCDRLVNQLRVNPRNSLASLKIRSLFIDHLNLLDIEPLGSLRCVEFLLVEDCSGEDKLPEEWLLQNRRTLKDLQIMNGSSLLSLPDRMVRLTALDNLYIGNAILLEELPEFPTSLTSLEIYGPRGWVNLSNL